MRCMSRTKIENIINLLFNGINIFFCLLVIGACIYKSIHSGFSEIIICIYGGIIAALLVVNEIKVTNISSNYFHFLATHRGRSMIFFFFGCLVLDATIMNIVAGTLNLSLGLVYMIISFIKPSLPPPNPISLNWQSWKDFSAEGLDLPKSKHDSVESHVAIRLKSPVPQHFYSEEQQDHHTTVGPFRSPY